MLAGFSLALALLAETAGSASPAPPPAPTKAEIPADDSCGSAEAKADTRTIVICAQRPQGYRLNPDVIEARRELRSGGRRKRPERFNDRACSVGPQGCPSAGINLIGSALTAAEMAARLARGQEIGSMFVTDPQPTEYQLYLEAKRRREAREAEARAAAAAKANAASTATEPSGK